MELPLEITTIASRLAGMGACSVFLYGSRARGDNVADSDWEVGAVFADGDYVGRGELSALQTEKVVIYPFKLSELRSGTVSTPFTRSIWINEIIVSAETIAGQDIISSLTRPEITSLDILTDSAFYKARALDAMIAHREGHRQLARDLFVKSVLLGARALVLAEHVPFPESYDDIAQKAGPLLDEDTGYLLNLALEVRLGNAEISDREVFDNIGLQMKIEDRARERLRP